MSSKLFAYSTALCLCLSSTAYAQSNSSQSINELDSLDEIIVTGSPLTRSVDEAITGVSVLTGKELSLRLAGTIGETLKSEPGVSSTAFGAGASRPIIRGQGGDRVRVLNNGIGSIDASSASPDHAVAAEPAQAERIEVLRGAALLRYGSSGAGGVVNVIDGRIPRTLPEGGIDGALRVGVSTVDDGRNISGALDTSLGNFVLHLDGTYKKTDDYNIPGFAESAALRALEEAEHEEEGHDDDEHSDEEEAFGTLENSAVETKSVTGGLSYIGDRGFFGVSVHNFQSDYGIPGGHEHEEEHGDEDHDDEDHDEEEHEEEGEELVTIGLDQTRVDVNGRIDLDGFIETVQLFAGYADYKHTEFEGDEIGTVFTNEGYEVRLEAIQKERGDWVAAYGVQLRNREFSAVGDEAFVPPTNTQQIGVYTFHEKEFGDIHLEGAVRYETTNQEDISQNRDIRFNTISVSAGGDLHVSDAVRLGGTVFRTERAPTTEELFSNGPHLATGQFERGNVALDKEVSKGVELAFRHREDGHFLTVNGFYTDYDDYIFERETGETEDGLPVFEFTAVGAEFIGFEIQGGMDIAEIGTSQVKIDGLVEYVRAKTETGNLPRILPLSLLGGLVLENDNYSLRGEVEYVDAAKNLAAFETATEDYTLVNLFANWPASIGSSEINVSVGLMNILNDTARQHSSFLKDNVPLPGRNFKFAISTEF